MIEKSFSEKVIRQKFYIKNIRLNVRRQKKITQISQTELKKNIIGRKPVIQKSDGENHTQNYDDKKSGIKKLLRSNPIPKYSTAGNDNDFTYRKEDRN